MVAEELNQLWRQLERTWETSQTVWKDDMRLDFERKYWTTIEQASRRLIAEVNQLEQALQEIKSSTHNH